MGQIGSVIVFISSLCLPDGSLPECNGVMESSSAVGNAYGWPAPRSTEEREFNCRERVAPGIWRGFCGVLVFCAVRSCGCCCGAPRRTGLSTLDPGP